MILATLNWTLSVMSMRSVYGMLMFADCDFCVSFVSSLYSHQSCQTSFQKRCLLLESLQHPFKGMPGRRITSEQMYSQFVRDLSSLKKENQGRTFKNGFFY